MPTFHRYVAIGDSSTEGLVDPDGQGGYRGWADRLAQLIADAQDEPLEYANLAVRSLRLTEIRNRQFDDALAMQPDLMTIFGGVNDLIAPGSDLEAMRADLAAMYGEARAHDCTVATFTLPDPTSINPLGKHMRDRIFRFNDIVRAEAERYDVLVMDFQNYPIAEDPRLWFEDRLHGNELGHQRIAAAMAWRLGIAGADESWAEPLDDEPTRHRFREHLASDVDWIRRYLGPWLGKGLIGVPHGTGIEPKRPVPTVVPRGDHPEDPRDALASAHGDDPSGVSRWRQFRGEIAGLGTTSGVRMVVGRWTDSPYGSFADVMLQQADGWRALLAPTEEIAAFIASTYVFDEVVVGPVAAQRVGSERSVTAPGLDLGFVVGDRTGLGRLLRLVPARIATAPTWARLIAPVSALLVPGVRTYGSAGSGRWEAYGATDLHAITAATGSWRDRPLGRLAPVEPPLSVGFASTPRAPGLTTLVTTIGW